MPKPQGTYLHTKRVDKISRQAEKSKILFSRSRAEAVHRSSFAGLDLAGAREVTLRAQAIGSEPTSRGAIARKVMGELVEHLEDIRSELEELEGLHAELGAPMQEYRAASNGIGDLSASNVVALAMVTFTLVLAIERVVSRMRGGKGGAV